MGTTKEDTKRTPHSIDVHVGSRVRLRRMMNGMSQDRLGEALGLTFQQVQKYEKGVNRIGASRLWEIANILSVPIQFFYDDAVTNTVSAIDSMGFAEAPAAAPTGEFMDLLSTPEGVQLCRHFSRIDDPLVRRRIIDLIKTLSEGEENAA